MAIINYTYTSVIRQYCIHEILHMPIIYMEILITTIESKLSLWNLSYMASTSK